MRLRSISAIVMGSLCTLALAGTATPASATAELGPRSDSLAQPRLPAPAGAHKAGETVTLPPVRTTDPQGRLVTAHGVATVTRKESPRANVECNWVEGLVWYENSLGWRGIEYAMKINWCYDRVKQQNVSTSPPQTRGYVYPWAVVVGWEFKGVESSAQWDFYGDKWVTRSYTRGLFKLCPPRIVCTHEAHPEIWLDTYGDGGWEFFWKH